MRGDDRENEAVSPTQGEPCKFREHSQELLDPMASIRNLHMQQRQNRRSTQELNQTTPPAPQTSQIQVNQGEANLMTFTPIVEQQVPPVQGATEIQEQPKQQISSRKKNSEWTLNQRQFDHSKTQEISHILPGEQLNVFNGEESVSYLQLPVKEEKKKKTVSVQDVVKWDTEDAIAKSTILQILHHGYTFHASLSQV